MTKLNLKLTHRQVITNKSNRFGKSGFTLIEAVIYLGVAGIFALLVLSFLNGFLKTRSRIGKLATLQETSGYAFNQLTQEIHWSDQKPLVADNYSGANLDRLELVQTENQQTIVFRVQDNRLYKEIIPQSGTTISEPISDPQVIINSFQISDRSPAVNQISCLKIQLALEYSQSNPKIISENQTTISLRKTRFSSSE